MQRHLASAVIALALVACTATVPNGAPESSESLAASLCLAPRILVTQTSPFHEALVAWSIPDMDRACDAALLSDDRGTEHASCILLGLAYSGGDSVPRDAKKAFAYLRRGATCGFDFSGHDLFQAEYHGIRGRGIGCCGGVGCAPGCEAECDAALDHVLSEFQPALTTACEDKHASACFMLADLAGGQFLQHVGRVQPKGPIDRDALFEKAWLLGLGPACVRRGWSYYEEPAKERPWIEKGCAAGWGDACLERGRGLPIVEAMPWWTKACALGLDNVCSDLAEMQ